MSETPSCLRSVKRELVCRSLITRGQRPTSDRPLAVLSLSSDFLPPLLVARPRKEIRQSVKGNEWEEEGERENKSRVGEGKLREKQKSKVLPHQVALNFDLLYDELLLTL